MQLKQNTKKVLAGLLVLFHFFGVTTTAYADSFSDAAQEAKALGQTGLDSFTMPSMGSSDGEFNLTYTDKDGNQVSDIQSLFDNTDLGTLDELFESRDHNGAKELGNNARTDSLNNSNSELSLIQNSVQTNLSVLDPNALRNDPIMNDTKHVFSNIGSDEMFTQCDTSLNINLNDGDEVHVPDLKGCYESTSPASCSITRQIEEAYSEKMSCNIGEVESVVWSGWKDWAKNGKALLEIKSICSGTNAINFQMSIAAGECSAPDSNIGFINIGEDKLEVTSVSHCQKYYDTIFDKDPDRREVKLNVKDSSCDDFNCQATISTSGAYSNLSDTVINFQKQHALYTVVETIKEDPPGCYTGYQTCSAKEDPNSDPLDAPSSTKTWKCAEATNGKYIQSNEGVNISLTPGNEIIEKVIRTGYEGGEYDDFKRMFEGDDESLMCFQAEARSYSCESDSDVVCTESGDCFSIGELSNIEFDSCSAYKDDSSCSEVDAEALSADPGGLPLFMKRTFDCGYTGQTLDMNLSEEMNCSGPIRCMGHECVNPISDYNDGAGFSQAMAAGAIVDHAKEQSKDCLGAIADYSGDLKDDFSIHFYFNGLGLGSKAQAIEIEALRDEGFDVYGYSKDGNGISLTSFSTLFSTDIPPYFTTTPPSQLPAVYLQEKTGAQNFSLIGSGFSSANAIEDQMKVKINNQSSNFEDNCGANIRVFDGKKYECKVSNVGVKYDCCNASEVGVPATSMQQVMSAYAASKKMNEAFEISETLSGWAQEVAPDFYNGMTDAITSASEMFGSSSAEGAATVANSGSSSWFASLGQSMTNYAAEFTGQVFGETAQSSFFTADAAGNFAFTPPPAIMYAYYAYVTYQAIMLVLDMLFGCDNKDYETVQKTSQYLCTTPSRYCDKEVLGSCVTYKYTQCCYSSPIVRVLQEEVRRIAGVGRNDFGIPTNFGSGKHLNCAGFTPEQLTGVDWGLLDTQKIIDILVASGQIVDPSNMNSEQLQAFIQDKYSIKNMTDKSILNEEDVEAINKTRSDRRESITALISETQETKAMLEERITGLEATKVELQAQYDSLTLEQKSSETGTDLLERIQTLDSNIETHEIEVEKAQLVIDDSQNTLNTDPSLQPLTMEVVESLEQNNMPLEFLGKDVNQDLDDRLRQYRIEAINAN